MMYIHFFFYESNFMKTKPLILAKKIKNKAKNKVTHAEHKRKVSRLVILKIKNKTSEQSLAVTYIVLHADQSNLTILLSQVNIAKLFNDYILFSHVTDCTENKHYKRFFFFLTFCCIILRFLVLQIITVVWEIKKKSGKTKNK